MGEGVDVFAQVQTEEAATWRSPHWLHKHVSSPQTLRALLKRIERLRDEVRISRLRNVGRDPRADYQISME